MPIVQTKQVTDEVKPTKAPRRAFIGWVLFIVFLSLVGGAGGFFWNTKKINTTSLKQPEPETLGTSTALEETPPIQPKENLKILTPDQFHKLYERSSYPNTQELTKAPEITGDLAVDKYLQQLAERRGFKLRSIPIQMISKLGSTTLDEPFLLQEKAQSGWNELKEAAIKDGLNLTVTSGFRSIQDQRELFLQRMQSLGVKINQITNGSQDDLLVKSLELVAPPGYSRHHTGYTADFSCNGDGSFTFVSSPCYVWITKNNYQNAKKIGWIPSYPDGVINQGPEPEPWEFVWIGTNSLFE